MTHEAEMAKRMLAEEFKALVTDAEELLHVTADQTGDRAAEIRDRIQHRLRAAKAEFDRAEAAALRRIRFAASATDGYVHTHPWATAGVAAGAALLIGMLISRR